MLISAVPPLMLKTKANPEGLPIEVFDGLRASVDDDQIVPIVAAGLKSAKIVKGATLNIYPGAPYGMCTTRKDEINADLLAFFKAERAQAA